MSQSTPTTVRDRFNQLASRLTKAAGSPFALVAAVSIILVWALTGPIFNFSETWQLIINTGTTIITFLMVFVIQASQNRDSKALHLKLDEVIRAVAGARNELIGAEQSSEQQIREREEEFLEIAERGGVAAAGSTHASRSAADAARKAATSSDVRAAARTAAERAVRAESRARPSGASAGTGGRTSPAAGRSAKGARSRAAGTSGKTSGHG